LFKIGLARRGMAVMHIMPLRRMTTQISIAVIGSPGEIQSLTNSMIPYYSSNLIGEKWRYSKEQYEAREQY
jgi:hypothetical protein